MVAVPALGAFRILLRCVGRPRMVLPSPVEAKLALAQSLQDVVKGSFRPKERFEVLLRATYCSLVG